MNFKTTPENMITNIDITARGKDGIDYRIRLSKDHSEHHLYLTINADLYHDADREAIGPQKTLMIENYMKSDIEDWRKLDEKYCAAEKIEPLPFDTLEPWYAPPGSAKVHFAKNQSFAPTKKSKTTKPKKKDKRKGKKKDEKKAKKKGKKK